MPDETRALTEAERDRIRQEARADAFEDAAAIIRAAGQQGRQLLTPEDWDAVSFTFSNEAVLTRRALARATGEG